MSSAVSIKSRDIRFYATYVAFLKNRSSAGTDVISSAVFLPRPRIHRYRQSPPRRTFTRKKHVLYHRPMPLAPPVMIEDLVL